jgi:hypothetical protein
MNTQRDLPGLDVVACAPPSRAGCLGCGGELRERLVKFKDGSRHRRLECAVCGRYLHFLPRDRTEGSLA